MRACEERSAALGVPPEILMDRAGSSVAQLAAQLLERQPSSVLVLVGPGNNGGDGLVAARYLRESGFAAVCYVWHRSAEGDRVREAATAAGVPVVLAEADPDRSRLRELVGRSALIVDALLGTGLSRPLSEELRDILSLVATERGRRPLLAVDVPTGLNSDTGAVDEATVPANVTITLGHAKAGLFVMPGARYAGRVVIGDIGLPPGCEVESLAELLDAQTVAGLLPKRPAVGHKGTFGKVLVVAGSPNYVGAAALACQAAYRAGTGLVTLATARQLHPILAGKLTETTFLPLPEEEPGVLGPEAVPDVLTALGGYDAVLVGPGLGRHYGTAALVMDVVRSYAEDRLQGAPLPLLILDADALNALAGVRAWWQGLGPRAVVTPHPGEMARLLRGTVAEVESDRIAVASGAAADWGLVVVLKGAYTVVASPEGRPVVSPIATAALATAGSGDVLAGALAGLAAQGLSARDAALAAVYLHGRAGELLAAEVGDAGGVAGDLLPLLPRVQRELRGTLHRSDTA